MDWILLVIIVIYFIIGVYKGFVSTIFSFIGFLFVAFVSYKLCIYLGGILQNTNILGENFILKLQNMFDNLIEGTFSNTDDLYLALTPTKYGRFFVMFAKIFFGSYEIEGQMTAGQILAPKLSILFYRIIAFILIFIIISIIILIFKWISEKIIKIFHLKWKNKLLGGAFGIVRGLCVFSVLYVILLTIANVTLNEDLILFMQSGMISNQIYDVFIIKIISLIY